MNGHWHLGGSPFDTNIDCGQDLLLLREWIDRHPEARGIKVAVNGIVEPRNLGIRGADPPRRMETHVRDRLPRVTSQVKVGPMPGWYAMSVNRLRSRGGEYRYFLRFRPVATVGYSIYVYHLDEGDIEWFEHCVGLESLAEAGP
jgi:hypothetical protein